MGDMYALFRFCNFGISGQSDIHVKKDICICEKMRFPLIGGSLYIRGVAAGESGCI